MAKRSGQKFKKPKHAKRITNSENKRVWKASNGKEYGSKREYYAEYKENG